ncbi:MAG: hypothetical protein ABI723_09200 [Bacteroidia bacterium]
MKTTTLIGGMRWASTIDYYLNINKMVNESTGGSDAACCIILLIKFWRHHEK